MGHLNLKLLREGKRKNNEDDESLEKLSVRSLKFQLTDKAKTKSKQKKSQLWTLRLFYVTDSLPHLFGDIVVVVINDSIVHRWIDIGQTRSKTKLKPKLLTHFNSQGTCN